VDPIHIDGREYKLLLRPTKFKGDPSDALANAFWTKHLRPIIQERLDKRSNGKGRFKGQFEPARIRNVRYWDTQSHALAGSELTLRQRGKASDKDGSQEITLKLRTSDLFISALTAVTGSQRDATTELEEDIAPLQVQAGGRKVVADYSATRSRFSRSTTQSIGSDALPDTLAEACGLFPSLAANLMRREHERGLTLKTRLAAGPRIEEHVFKGPKVELGSGIRGEFALTLWYFEKKRKKRKVLKVSEISFKCDLDGGVMPVPVARRAHRLFVAMQEELADWANIQDSSKTELALPR
jgi:hypothetical protein